MSHFFGSFHYTALIALSVGLGSTFARTDDEPSTTKLMGVIPSDIVAAVFIDPTPVETSASNWSALDLARPLADQAQQFGLLSVVGSDVRVWVDSFAAISLVMDYPFSVALFDIHADSRPGGSHRLADLRAALVIDIRSNSKAIEQRIQHLLTTYTNSEFSTLEHRQVGSNTRFELRDRRLPKWLTFSWGEVGEFYVIAIGNGAFERIATSPKGAVATAANDPWVQPALRTITDVPSNVVVYARVDQLQRCLGTGLEMNIHNVLHAVRLDGMRKGLLTMGAQDRSIEVSGAILRRGGTETRRLVSRRFETPLTRAAIPEQAQQFALVDADLGLMMKGLTEAVWSGRSASARAAQERFWSSIDADSGVQLDRDIYARLGGPLVLHNYPRHPLGLSLAWNILVPIKGDPKTFQRNLDTWLTTLAEFANQDGAVQLHRSDDGVWYTQFGLLGPAVDVTNGWLVIGFSPFMVRQVVAQVENATH